MDNLDPAQPTRSWAPAVRLVVAGWAVAAFAWCLLAADPPGRLLAGIGAAAATAAALYGTVARPRLTVDQDGIVVRGMTGARHWPWAQVRRVRVTRHRRLGRDLPALELDVVDADQAETLIVLARLELDADPVEVLDEINAVRGG